MNILAGTFRLSIVAAAIAALGFMWVNIKRHDTEQTEHWRLVYTLKCGARIEAATLERYKNAGGNFDIGTAGCSDKPFWANIQEMSDAASGKLDTKTYWINPAFDTTGTLVYAVSAILLVNLAGLGIVAGRVIARWVAAGFKRS